MGSCQSVSNTEATKNENKQTQMVNGKTSSSLTPSGQQQAAASSDSDSASIALLRACKSPLLSAVEAALKLDGCDLNYAGAWGNTPLITSCLYVNSEVAMHLLEIGANFDKRNEKNVGPLTYASCEGMVDVVDYIVKRRRESGWTQEDRRQQGEERGKVYCSSIDKNVCVTPLRGAVIGGHLGVVKVLLENGITEEEGQVRVRTEESLGGDNNNYDKMSLVHISCKLAHADILPILCANCAETIDDRWINEAVGMCCQCQSSREDGKDDEVLKLLLNSDLVRKNTTQDAIRKSFAVGNDMTPLHHCCRAGCVAMVLTVIRIILRGGTGGITADAEGRTTGGSNTEEYGVNKRCSRKGWTPFMYLISSPNLAACDNDASAMKDVIHEFETAGYDFAAKDKHGRSVADLGLRNVGLLGGENLKLIEAILSRRCIEKGSEQEQTRAAELPLPGIVQ